MVNILGISAFFHDSAACIVRDGVVLAAVQEERLTRRKHDPAFPTDAIAACLDIAGITADELDHVAFYEKPHLKFERILSTYATHHPHGWETFQVALPLWLQEKLRMPGFILDEIRRLSPTGGSQMMWDGRIVFPEHHTSHAASAFFASPFKDAAILTIDGVGEWATTTMAEGREDGRGVPRIQFLNELHYPHSLGMLYSTFTAYLGFRVNSGEYKVMGLAPYGEPRFVSTILGHLIDLREDGSFQLNLDHFSFPYSAIMFKDSFERLFGMGPRRPEGLLEQEHLDIAASIQRVTDIVVERMARYLKTTTGLDRLCMAGGVALNCVTNGLLHRSGLFDDIWIQPAAGDAGGALGAALFVWHEVLGERRPPLFEGRDVMQGALLGPRFSNDEVRAAIEEFGLPYRVLPSSEVPSEAARHLASSRVIGWFQGRMEFGPRALGARSILGDARSPSTQRVMNLKIKYRESFRPFAPAVLRDHVADWFELKGHPGSLLGGEKDGYDSPYMLLVAPVAAHHRRTMTTGEEALFGIEKLNVSRSDIPACTHVDYSARVQTVRRDDNPRFHDLILSFYEETGVPVVVNTSFNVRGEPIVCTPRDAIKCFLGTEMDSLFIEDCIIEKSDVPEEQLLDYKDAFQPD